MIFFLRKILISQEMEKEEEEKIRRNKSTDDWHAETLFIKQHFPLRFSSASLICRHVLFITNVANFYDFFLPFHLKSRHTFKNFYKHFVNMIHQNVHQSINIHPRATIKSELVNRFCMPDLLRCNKETIRKLKIVYQFPYTEITSHAIKTCNRRWLTCNFCVNQIFSMPLTEYSTWRIKTCHTQPTLLMSF